MRPTSSSIGEDADGLAMALDCNADAADNCYAPLNKFYREFITTSSACDSSSLTS